VTNTGSNPALTGGGEGEFGAGSNAEGGKFWPPRIGTGRYGSLKGPASSQGASSTLPFLLLWLNVIAL
jgi:hypothetical protein